MDGALERLAHELGQAEVGDLWNEAVVRLAGGSRVRQNAGWRETGGSRVRQNAGWRETRVLANAATWFVRRAQHDVARFQIAVQDAALVGVGHRLGKRGDE